MVGKYLKIRELAENDYAIFFKLYELENIDYYPCPAEKMSGEELRQEFRFLFRGGIFFILETMENRPIGYCYSECINRKNMNLEFWLKICEKSMEKFEYYYEALLLLFGYFFKVMNLHKAYCAAYEFETEKIKALEKIRATRVGVMPEDLFRDGRFHDKYVYNIFERDYTQSQKEEF